MSLLPHHYEPVPLLFLLFKKCTFQNQFQKPQADVNFSSRHKLFAQAKHKSGEVKLFLGLPIQREAGGIPESKPIN